MYKILVTSLHSNFQAGCAVHTIVIEFDSEMEADLAIRKINGNETKSVDRQQAIALY